MAERVGFEPTIRDYRIPDFESGAFGRSATSPEVRHYSVVLTGIEELAGINRVSF